MRDEPDGWGLQVNSESGHFHIGQFEDGLAHGYGLSGYEFGRGSIYLGIFENGIRNGILKAIKLYGQKNQFSKISNINHNDIFDYSNVIISIFINDPSFEGQTKKRIIMPNLQKEIETSQISNCRFY